MCTHSEGKIRSYKVVGAGTTCIEVEEGEQRGTVWARPQSMAGHDRSFSRKYHCTRRSMNMTTRSMPKGYRFEWPGAWSEGMLQTQRKSSNLITSILGIAGLKHGMAGKNGKLGGVNIFSFAC